jgi:hypothetical protein
MVASSKVKPWHLGIGKGLVAALVTDERVQASKDKDSAVKERIIREDKKERKCIKM